MITMECNYCGEIANCDSDGLCSDACRREHNPHAADHLDVDDIDE
jgi:hypothetical protein